MERNLDKIITELNFLNSKFNQQLDIIEPIFNKDIIEIEDIELLKSLNFSLVKSVDFINIIMPILNTDENGYIREKELVKNIIHSSLSDSKDRFENLFESKTYLFNEKANEYKTKFFKLGYSIDFIESFISNLYNQSFVINNFFEFYAGYLSLFDFTELVKLANKEPDLTIRRQLYTAEYERVNLLWIRYENNYRSCIDLDNENEEEELIDEAEEYDEEYDEYYQVKKMSHLEFLSNCQKAIESINYQIENSIIKQNQYSSNKTLNNPIAINNTNQIVSKLKAINDNLLETIQILNLYLQGGILTPLKVDSLKELKQTYSFNTFSDIIEPIKEDKQLTNNIVNAVFLDLWKFTFDFLDLSNFKQNDKKFNEYRVKIIQIGNEIDFYLDAIDCLRYNLNCLHMFFTTFAIPFTGKWSIEKYGINLDYNDLLLEALNEYDLTKRKEFILKKLHTAELFKLQDTVDKEDFDEFEDFIDKCYKVVESIDFQIKNVTTPTPTKKLRSILDEKKDLQEVLNNPEAFLSLEEANRNLFRKLTDKDIELVTNDCNTLNEVYVKGLDVFEAYFSNNQINSEDIQFLQTDPFSGLLSDNYFGAMVLSHFDDQVVIGTIFDICFADTIFRIQNLDFTFSTTPDLNNEPRLKELIRSTLKNKNNSVLIKDNLLSFAKEIRELIQLVYSNTGNKSFIKDVNLDAYQNKTYLSIFENESTQDEIPENFNNNGGIITTGSYDIEEYYKFFSNKYAKKELYLVDKLEISLAHYASNYKKNCDDFWETYQFDPNFFNEFISGDLFSEFNLELHDYIKPLNNHEINRYLTASIQQFKTHTPEKRKEMFCEIYHDTYWYPNYMKYTGSSARDNYVLHVWKLYSNHFNLFQEATQSAYDIFKASLINGSANSINNNNLEDNTKKGNKTELLKSNLYENGFYELTKVKSLSHDGQSKLIDLLVLNGIPYNVAMFDYIGFFKFLENEKSLTKSKIHKTISSILDCTADNIKCNMLALLDYSKIDKDRYTSHKHKEKVKIDYHSLK